MWDIRSLNPAFDADLFDLSYTSDALLEIILFVVASFSLSVNH